MPSGTAVKLNTMTAGEAIRRANEKIVPKKTDALKKYPCFYCKKMETTPSRHYLDHHSDELIVKKLAGTKGERRKKGVPISDEQIYRNEIFSFLRKSAIDKHNFQALFDDQIVTARRVRRDQPNNTLSMYGKCSKCKGYYVATYLHKHQKKCLDQKVVGHQSLLMSRKIFGNINADITVQFQKILLHLRCGEIKNIIESDALIIDYGNGYSFKYQSSDHYGKMIRARVRLLARMLIILRRLCPDIKFFCDLFTPEYYDFLIPAINEIGNFNKETNLYDNPAPAAAAGAYAKELCDLHITRCIKRKDRDARQDAVEFNELYASSFNKYVTRTVAESQVENQRKKLVNLPDTSDINKLYAHIVATRDDSIKHLEKFGFDITIWKQLGEAILVHMQIFNCRRAGETERLKLSNFRKAEKFDKDHENLQKLSQEDKSFLSQFYRILLRGKLNRTVPMLLSKKDKEGLDLFLSFRDKAGVQPSNPYVFGIESTDTTENRYLLACDILRKYSAMIGAKFPERLRGTLFRKNVSTMAMSLELTAGVRSDLYQFLGHSESINKNIYAQNLFQQQVLAIAPILLKATNCYEGKNKEKLAIETDSEEEKEMDDDEKEYNSQIPKIDSLLVLDINNTKNKMKDINFNDKDKPENDKDTGKYKLLYKLNSNYS